MDDMEHGNDSENRNDAWTAGPTAPEEGAEAGTTVETEKGTGAGPAPEEGTGAEAETAGTEAATGPAAPRDPATPREPGTPREPAAPEGEGSRAHAPVPPAGMGKEPDGTAPTGTDLAPAGDPAAGPSAGSSEEAPAKEKKHWPRTQRGLIILVVVLALVLGFVGGIAGSAVVQFTGIFQQQGVEDAQPGEMSGQMPEGGQGQMNEAPSGDGGTGGSDSSDSSSDDSSSTDSSSTESDTATGSFSA